MRRLFQVFFTLGLGLLLLPGCKKEIDQFVPIPEPVDLDFGADFSDASDTMHFTIEGSGWHTVYTPKGTAFILKPGMFEYRNGDLCDCESVDVRIIELAEIKDMLVHNTPTITGDALLASEGAYHVSATHQGKSLRLVEQEQICFVLPSEDLDKNMELFYGDMNQGSFKWLPASGFMGSQAHVKKGEWPTESALIVGYECFSDEMDWIGVNKYISDGIDHRVCIKLSEFFTADNTVLFALPEGKNAVVRLMYDMTDGFCTGHLPIGSAVKYIGVARRDENIYELASESTVIEKNQVQTLSFNPMSLNDIRTVLESL